MVYRSLTQNEFHLGDYSVVPFREEDLEAIMRWRNDQIRVLRQARPLTMADQRAYYKTAIRPSFDDLASRIILFSYLERGICIGYGGLTNIDRGSRRAELSFLLDTSRIGSPESYRQDFASFITLMKQVAFAEMEFHRLFTETYDIRPFHVQIMEENGFVLEGRLRDHVLIDGGYVDSLMHGMLHPGGESQRDGLSDWPPVRGKS